MLALVSLVSLVSLGSAVSDLDALYPELETSRTIYVTENGPRLSVVADQTKLLSRRGGNATLPCSVQTDQSGASSRRMRIKWTKLTSDYLKEEDVFVAMGYLKRSFGRFHGRVHLQGSSPTDASLVISEITLEDYGKYKCEVIDGLEDGTVVVTLDLEGVVFPYFPRLGRYHLNFYEAQRACREQDAVVASFEQLQAAWRAGLDWCNAGWLSDGTVQYPITAPRGPCGGRGTAPGVRSYGLRDKERSHYDVFCFTSHHQGRFYYLPRPSKLTFAEAVGACERDGARIASVGQMFAAWRLRGFDRCDGGWLADGSVRYPISTPRRRCGPAHAGVRLSGFPDKKHKLYGAYCYQDLKRHT
ncbi:hyaluronan and proteoglycan link protein 1 [Menidia menidia]